ncbi:ATP-dependent sacrificial sulfur transferase LarE [Parabacteroides sp. FAFU027]|uniref:ATP-dependent sacrificial sulfur transferase LarE n=1 Tax=Parabacteroides sp. FAFU027 TaxID=2922715 RepID=UPI001FAE8DA1|nr:ATP-dependent sacrificial sulfur transferase LarE [Parabacteroides sp. FAFU027]
MTLQDKYERLKAIIANTGKAAVAFSGGVDSTFLSKVCHDVLQENAIAITLVSPMNAQSEMKDAEEMAQFIGITHYMVQDGEIDDVVAANPVDRCYHCKKIEFTNILEKARECNIFTVFDGSNIDDLSDYRPGLKALSELKIVSPLREAGLTKSDIRQLSKELGLKTWDKPAFACLASRVPYGEKITPLKLSKIDRSEDYLRSLGFVQFRVRSHGDMARIEVSPTEREKLFDAEKLDMISQKLKSFGYLYVCMELEGYKTGSLNREISKS